MCRVLESGSGLSRQELLLSVEAIQERAETISTVLEEILGPGPLFGQRNRLHY